MIDSYTIPGPGPGADSAPGKSPDMVSVIREPVKSVGQDEAMGRIEAKLDLLLSAQGISYTKEKDEEP